MIAGDGIRNSSVRDETTLRTANKIAAYTFCSSATKVRTNVLRVIVCTHISQDGNVCERKCSAISESNRYHSSDAKTSTRIMMNPGLAFTPLPIYWSHLGFHQGSFYPIDIPIYHWPDCLLDNIRAPWDLPKQRRGRQVLRWTLGYRWDTVGIYGSSSPWKWWHWNHPHVCQDWLVSLIILMLQLLNYVFFLDQFWYICSFFWHCLFQIRQMNIGTPFREGLSHLLRPSAPWSSGNHQLGVFLPGTMSWSYLWKVPKSVVFFGCVLMGRSGISVINPVIISWRFHMSFPYLYEFPGG